MFYFLVKLFLFTGYSDEEYETDPETKVKGPKPTKDGSEDSDVSIILKYFVMNVLHIFKGSYFLFHL